MNYINGKSIFDLNLSTQQLIELFKQLSRYLKYYHQYGIVLADLNLTNIIFDERNIFYFVDIDSARIHALPNDNIPTIVHNYLLSKGYKTSEFVIDESFDNLSLLLHFLYLIFGNTPIYNLDQKQIDEYIETKKIEIPFIKKFVKEETKVPYFDQMF